MTTAILAALYLSVTNYAGTALHGEYVRTTSSHVFLRNDRGETFSIPYAALPKRERDRVRRAAGVYEPPKEYRELVDFYRAELKRIDLLEKNGTLSAEAAAKRRAGERKSFEGVRNRLIREGVLDGAALRGDSPL